MLIDEATIEPEWIGNLVIGTIHLDSRLPMRSPVRSQIGDVVFTTPAIRALRAALSRRAPHLPRRAGRRAGRRRQSASRTRSSSRRGARGVARAARRPRARPAAARRALRPRDRFSRRPARVAAHVAERRAACASATTSPAAAGCTRRASPRPRELRPRHSVENQWDLLDALGIAAARSRDASRRDGGRRRRGRAPSRERLAARRRRAPATELDRGARQRGQSVPALAGRARSSRSSRRWRAGDARRRVVVTSGPSERDAAARVIAEARARARRRRRASACWRAASSRSPSCARCRSRGALHRRRQRTAAHRRDEHGADRRALRADAAGAVGAVAGAALDRARRWKSAACRAGRAISASASPATSAA